MTVTAVKTIVTDVMFVTELNWLLPFDPLTGVPGRTIQLNSDPQQSNNYEESAIDRNLCQRVSAMVEDLWHCRRIECRVLVNRYRWQTNSPQIFRIPKFLLQSNGVLYQKGGEFQIGPQKSTKSAKRDLKQ